MSQTKDIRDAVESELSYDPLVNDALTVNITVPDGVEATASNGNVLLTGTVRYGTERTAAEQAVTYLTGVRNVRDEIEVGERHA